MKKLAIHLSTMLVGSVVILSGGQATATTLGEQFPHSTVLDSMQTFEEAKEPKCYATASRLEDVIYGTPLTKEARFSKSLLQKDLALTLWKSADKLANAKGTASISADMINDVVAKNMVITKEPSGHLTVKSEDNVYRIHKDDKRQYSNVAYSLRAILAAQQDQLLGGDKLLTPLAEEAVKQLKDTIDIHTLISLQIADEQARLTDQYTVEKALMERSWASVTPKMPNQMVHVKKSSVNTDFSMLHAMVKQKEAAYAAYNNVSNQLFLRNLQVYYARMPWKPDGSEAQEFKSNYSAAMINFATDLYLGAQQVALSKGHGVIGEEDVYSFIKGFIPHYINEYEDAIFFPHLPRDQQLTIEAYDMDAYRDGGLHWRYLQFAIEEPGFKGVIEPDPFAAELMTENIAQFGVLILRIAGNLGKEQQQESIKPENIAQAFGWLQKHIKSDAEYAAKAKDKSPQKIASSAATTKPTGDDKYFSDITQSAGISFEHRTSDWLSRMIRSYVVRDGVGQLSIPPAFGGAGVAAEDFNQDGWPDILLLSGSGNKLLLNDKKGHFVDATETSGLEWKRPDNTPGEPRQPVVVDFNNDGLNDILITYVNDKHRLYQNIGNGKFNDVTDKANLGGENLVGGPATSIDVNKDGLMDIYIGYFGNYIEGIFPTLKRRNENGLPNRLFLNKGNFKFEDITEKSGVGNTGWAQAIGHTDIDNDGWQDLIAGNDFGVNIYYRNKGDNTFENIADIIGTGKPSYTMNIGIADLNDDNFPDIYISNIVTMNKDESYITPNLETPMKFNPNKLGTMQVVEANDLFLSSGVKNGLPEYELSKLVGRGYSSTGWSWDADFFDFDNDGDEDLYVLNGMNEFAVYSNESPYYQDPLTNEAKDVFIPVHERETNVFFVNQDGKLSNLSQDSGLDVLSNSRSAAYFDYDMDGDLDIIVNDYHGPARLFRNNSDKSNNWLTIHLTGNGKTVSTDAVGARIIVKTPTNSVWREINSTIGYLSVHPKDQHFGVGDAKKVNVEVTWPSGEKQTIKDVDVNQRYQIVQGSDIKKI